MKVFGVVIDADNEVHPMVLRKYDLYVKPKVGDVVDLRYRVVDVLTTGATTVIALKEM